LEYAFSERRACWLMLVAVSMYRYRSRRDDSGLRRKLRELALEKPRFGYRRLHVLLRREGQAVNHKRVHRVYRELGLMIRRKKRKHCVREGKPLIERTAANQEWALDFRARRGGVRTSDPGAERGRCLHTRMFGFGSGCQFCFAAGDASTGCDHR
jgi:transposase InsO family protein